MPAGRQATISRVQLTRWRELANCSRNCLSDYGGRFLVSQDAIALRSRCRSFEHTVQAPTVPARLRVTQVENWFSVVFAVGSSQDIISVIPETCNSERLENLRLRGPKASQEHSFQGIARGLTNILCVLKVQLHFKSRAIVEKLNGALNVSGCKACQNS